MEKKSTALQQLEKVIEYNYKNNQGVCFASVMNLIEQLKPIEREDIEEAWLDGKSNAHLGDQMFDNYFNKTYNS